MPASDQLLGVSRVALALVSRRHHLTPQLEVEGVVAARQQVPGPVPLHTPQGPKPSPLAS